MLMTYPAMPARISPIGYKNLHKEKTMRVSKFLAAALVGVVAVTNVHADTFTITPGITGSWYNPKLSGQGFNIEVLPNNLIGVYFYTFDPNGNNLWLTGLGVYGGEFPNTASIPLTETTGGLFPPKLDPTQIQRKPWGQLTITFTDCNTASATWSPTIAGSGYSGGTSPIQRLTSVAGLSCP
jgi:hypothetical protein